MKLTFKLNPQEIEVAVRQIKAYKANLNEAINVFIERLLDAGVEIAKTEVLSLGAFDTGALYNSIYPVMYFEENRGLIIAGSSHAAFVEFGTGVVGSADPHPAYPWSYDTNGHGEAGWVYFNEDLGMFFWTKGIPSRPFMFNTARELERLIPQFARELFNT